MGFESAREFAAALLARQQQPKPRIARGWRLLLVVSLSPVFTSGALAQARTIPPPRPLQTTVWVNTNNRIYHCPGSRFYGTTNDGEYMSEAAARARGNGAAERTACSPKPDPPLPLRPLTPGEVWINTESGLYHCPDSRLYGQTKRGRFRPEADARSLGYRAAARRACA